MIPATDRSTTPTTMLVRAAIGHERDHLFEGRLHDRRQADVEEVDRIQRSHDAQWKEGRDQVHDAHDPDGCRRVGDHLHGLDQTSARLELRRQLLDHDGGYQGADKRRHIGGHADPHRTGDGRAARGAHTVDRQADERADRGNGREDDDVVSVDRGDVGLFCRDDFPLGLRTDQDRLHTRLQVHSVASTGSASIIVQMVPVWMFRSNTMRAPSGDHAG